MKRFLALTALVLACALLLAGCGKSGGDAFNVTTPGGTAYDGTAPDATAPDGGEDAPYDDGDSTVTADEVCGVYYLESADDKSAWDYAVGRVVARYGVDEATAEAMMAEYGADENDPASLCVLTLKADGTLTQGGLIGVSEPAGTWSLEGSTVVLNLVATQNCRYHDGTITRTNSFGEVYVYAKAE